mmetsp:Transcript_12499/g.18347  ORF Transcript_12499/g.18347 Transcript_12499/m.18347 type:complete len:208 (-) Transcript_12499:136-759(-)
MIQGPTNAITDFIQIQLEQYRSSRFGIIGNRCHFEFDSHPKVQWQSTHKAWDSTGRRINGIVRITHVNITVIIFFLERALTRFLINPGVIPKGLTGCIGVGIMVRSCHECQAGVGFYGQSTEGDVIAVRGEFDVFPAAGDGIVNVESWFPVKDGLVVAEDNVATAAHHDSVVVRIDIEGTEQRTSGCEPIGCPVSCRLSVNRSYKEK